eukprot:1513225-Rhodomonas_salina.3
MNSCKRREARADSKGSEADMACLDLELEPRKWAAASVLSLQCPSLIAQGRSRRMLQCKWCCSS